MPHVVLIEPEGSLRDLLRPHLGAMGGRLELVADIEDAQHRVRFGESVMVLARGRGDHGYAAELACAFDIDAKKDPTRLVVIETGAATPAADPSASSYLNEIGLTLACTQFATAPAGVPEAHPGMAPDFPHDTYRVLSRVGELACGLVFLVRHRLGGAKALLVQTRDDHVAAGCVAEALYRNFRGRARPWVHTLRHEVTAYHSFISSVTLPFDLARQADLAAA